MAETHRPEEPPPRPKELSPARSKPMYPLIPGEMINSAIQLAVFFFTAIGALIGLMLTARA